MFLTFSECVYWSQFYLKRKLSRLTSNLAITGNYLFLRTILLRDISVSWVTFWSPVENCSVIFYCNGIWGKPDFYLKYSCLLRAFVLAAADVCVYVPFQTTI